MQAQLITSARVNRFSHLNACRAFVAGLFLALLTLAATNTSALTEEQLAEYKIKAAFLYKFGSYIEWPDNAFAAEDTPFTVGIIGAEELADSLEEIVANRTVGGRPVEVRKLDFADPLSGVQVLFIGQTGPEILASVLETTKQQPVLIVTETEDSLSLGSMINFVVADNKVRFDVALDSAQRSNLKISSRLLAVARKVVTENS